MVTLGIAPIKIHYYYIIIIMWLTGRLFIYLFVIVYLSMKQFCVCFFAMRRLTGRALSDTPRDMCG